VEVGFPAGPLEETDELSGVEFVEGRAVVDLVGLGGAGEETDGDARHPELVHDGGGQPADAAHAAVRAGEAHAGRPRVVIDVEAGGGRSKSNLATVTTENPDPRLLGGRLTGDRSGSRSLQVGGDGTAQHVGQPHSAT
jgi:hypothetical protein